MGLGRCGKPTNPCVVPPIHPVASYRLKAQPKLLASIRQLAHVGMSKVGFIESASSDTDDAEDEGGSCLQRLPCAVILAMVILSC